MGGKSRGQGAVVRRGLGLVLAITAAYAMAEVVGGLLSGSLALLADAGHMLTDIFALSLALVAKPRRRRPARTTVRTTSTTSTTRTASGIGMDIQYAWTARNASSTRFFCIFFFFFFFFFLAASSSSSSSSFRDARVSFCLLRRRFVGRSCYHIAVQIRKERI